MHAMHNCGNCINAVAAVTSGVMAEAGIRERKKRRTREAIVDAGTRLFAEHGYEATTVAQIAAAADIAPRTFFTYFETKEQLLFPESDARIDAALAAIGSRRPDEPPVDVLLRSLDDVLTASDEMVGDRARLRLKLMTEAPRVHAYGLQLQARAQRQITEHLQAAYPDLEDVTASALVGAFIGAAAAAASALGEGDDQRTDPTRTRLRQAVAAALGQTSTPDGGLGGLSDERCKRPDTPARATKNR